MRKQLGVIVALIVCVASVHAATLISTNELWRFSKGTNEASQPDIAAWRGLFFSDTNFVDAAGPFWYGDVYTGGTVIPDMLNNYFSIFLRKTFVVTNLAEVGLVQLGAFVDDGFVAWINGVEVARVNMPGGAVTTNTAATAAAGEPALFTFYTLAAPGTYLVAGTNVLAIQVFNSTLASSDLGFDASLATFVPDVVPPTVTTQTPSPGTVTSLSSITVVFSEPVAGVSASDLLVNGQPATSVSGAGDTHVFSFPAPAYGTVNITWDSNHGISDFGLPPNPFDHNAGGVTWSYTFVDNAAPTIVFRAPAAGASVIELNTLQINFSEGVQGVDAADLIINGSPATNVLIGSASIYTFQFAPQPTGTVSVAFAGGHGITDLAAAPNAFAGDSWSNSVAGAYPTLVISEFLAANSGGGTNAYRDEDGDSSDWIEIYNPNATVENIGGWFLTDTVGTLAKWRFPSGATIPGQGYLVVFASNKNRTNNPAKFHANFQLANGGEYLALVTPMTNVMSQFSPTFPEQSTDVSYGRDRLDAALVGYYTVPTPGSNNTARGTGFGPEVQFSRDGSTFVGSFPLTLSVPDTNSVIRYVIVNTANTTNAVQPLSIPTSSSTLYTGPITVNSTVQVRARAFPLNTNVFPGNPRTECYVQVDAGISNFVSSLPIVVIHTLAPAQLAQGYPAFDNVVTVMTFDNDGGTATLLKTPQLVRRGAINLRGSSTQGFSKSSYAVELWDEYNIDEEESFLGLPKESDWVLYAPNQFDVSLMHNPLLHNFATEMGYYSARTRFVEVFFRNNSGAITANTNITGAAMGDYAGVYVLQEKVKRDGNRVDIDEVQSGLTDAALINGGYLLKIDRADGNERTFTGAGVTIVYQDPDGLEMVTPARAAQASYLNSFFNQFNASINFPALTNATGTNHYSHYLNVIPSIDLHIANTLTLNVDGYRLSGYIHKPRDGKMIWGPLWDCDRGQGTSKGDGRAFNPRSWQASNPSGSGGTDNGTDFFQGATAPLWLGRVFADLDFWQLWIDRYQMWRTSVLDTNHIAAVIDGFGNQLRQAQVREVKRWTGSSGSDTSPRNGTLASFNGDYSHNFNGTYQGEIDFQKRWYTDRVQFFDTNLLGRPTLNVAQGMVSNGTVVTLTDTSGKGGTAIYYTLDGSDPRVPQGLTNPAAILYTGPITISGNVRVRARAVNASHSNQTGIYGISAAVPAGTRAPVLSSRWSGDNAVTYFTAVPQLAVTEIMFHPEPPPAGNTNDADNFEYIELKNNGVTALNLTGYRFTNGIDFIIPATSATTNLAPGGYLIVVKSLAAFATRYGPRTNIVGEYAGSLDNSGERITLVGSRLEPILDFTYGDTWFDLADGRGFSLVLANEGTAFTNYSHSASWRQSNIENGSPGVVDPAPRAFPQVVVSEALTHTDLPQVDVIEIWNLAATNVSITGWFLTDSLDSPKKFAIPSATIPPGGFVTFNEPQFNAGGNGFALGSEGDEVYVFSGDGTNLTGYYHGFDFGAAQNGVTFGRHLNSQGEEFFTAQSANTLGATNALPQVGPVVITEIHYHPPETQVAGVFTDNPADEFVELRNITASAVSLYDTNHPTNIWRLTRGVDYDLPANITLAAGGYALLVNFDPANTGLLAAFRARFGAPANVPVFGPLGGKLDNSSETVKLSRPDNPNLSTGIPPYIEVDRVRYSDAAPWPIAADGFTPSLQRLVEGDFGNDPTNWIAAVPNPGTATVSGSPPVITQQPAGVGAIQNSNATLSVVATGAPPLRYQWRIFGNSIPGATNTILNLTNMQFVNAGEYSVAIFNLAGSVVSISATVTVRALPVITLQPVAVATNWPPATTTLSIMATAAGPLTFQWTCMGTNLPGATSSNLVITTTTNTQLFGKGGFYNCLVSDSVGAISSQNSTMIVMWRPVITNNPVARTAVQNQNVTLSVLAGPDHPVLPLSYRWLRNSTTYLAQGSSSFTYSNVQATFTARVAVTNLAGSTASSIVTITVIPDSDGDGMPDNYEIANGLNPSSAAGADGANGDYDGDGMTNHQEYIAGTDPRDPLNYLRFEPLQVESGTNTLLRFTAVSNRVYTVQTRDTLADTAWSNLFNISAAATNRVLSLTNNLPGVPTRFYRLAVQTQ